MPSPIRVGVSDLVAASRRYVEERVARANVNHNGYLTTAEAQKLPKDLRDNFEAFRKSHPRVSVKQFTKDFTEYVAKSAKAADKNNDGVLTATDARRLPKDLRDNFLNYVQATQGPTPTPKTETQLGREALADHLKNVIFNTGNPEGEAFRTAVLDWRTPAERATAKTSLEAEAAAWTPQAPDWEKTVTGGTTTYAGRFFQLYTELRFQPGSPKPTVYIEID